MKITTSLKILGILLSCLATCGQVFAQAQVVDAASANNTQQNPQTQAVATSQNDIMVDMYLQLEALQSEIQNLRGLVEEQSYQIRRMQTEQRDRYLDTDSRLSELFSYHAGQQPVGTQTSPDGNPSQITPFAGNSNQNVVPATGPANNTGVETTTAGTLNEQDLYRQALSQLLENEAFQDSVNLFQQYIDIYPQGRYFTNALYWQGAGLHLLGNYPQSIAVLQRLLNEYPQDPKAATAMLRLGTVYNEMGDQARAVDYWRRISETYPSSTSEIELARDYLRDSGI